MPAKWKAGNRLTVAGAEHGAGKNSQVKVGKFCLLEETGKEAGE